MTNGRECVIIVHWRNGADGGARQTVNLFSRASWFESIFLHQEFASMEKLVYSRDLKSLVERHAGSTPATRTMLVGLKVFMDAHDTVTVEEGDRYPLGPPSFIPQ